MRDSQPAGPAKTLILFKFQGPKDVATCDLVQHPFCVAWGWVLLIPPGEWAITLASICGMGWGLQSL